MLVSILLQISQVAQGVADTAAQTVQNLPAANATPKSISLLDFIIKGGPIMIPIGLLSVATLYIFFERYFVIRKAANIDNKFMSNVEEQLNKGNIEGARLLCKNYNNPISRMIDKGLSRIGKPIKHIETAIENMGKLELQKLEKNISILGIIAGIAPMFGFVGTIIGVIKIFYNISLADNISIGLIAGGLYEKMVTSASGLIVGIMAYVGYHYLTIKIDRIVFKMEANAVDFMDILHEPGH